MFISKIYHICSGFFMTFTQLRILIFIIFFPAYITCMQHDEHPLVNLPPDVQRSIISYLDFDLQAIGRLKLVCRGYNQQFSEMINFEEDTICGLSNPLSYYVSSNLDTAYSALISAAHADTKKENFFWNLFGRVKEQKGLTTSLLKIIPNINIEEKESVISAFCGVCAPHYPGDNIYKKMMRSRLKNAIENNNVLVTRILLASDYYKKEHTISQKECAEFLIEAVDNEAYDVVRLLIGRGFDVNASDGTFPLWHAVEQASKKEDASLECVNILLDFGANINQHTSDDYFGETVLHRAAIGKNVELITLLLVHRAEINGQDVEKKTPLIRACQYAANDHPVLPICNHYSNQNVIFALLNVLDLSINQQDGSGKTALMYICEKITHNINFIQTFIGKGADVTVQDNEGQTALHKAATCGNYGILEVLISGKGIAAINQQDKNGYTPLMCACKFGKNYMAQLLISKNACTFFVKDNDGMTALHHAAAHGLLDCVGLLLQKMGNIQVVDNHGNTPLHCIAMAQLKKTESNARNTETIIDLLVSSHDRCINRSNKDNDTPLFSALRAGNNVAVKHFMLKYPGTCHRKAPIDFLAHLSTKQLLTLDQSDILKELIELDQKKVLGYRQKTYEQEKLLIQKNHAAKLQEQQQTHKKAQSILQEKLDEAQKKLQTTEKNKEELNSKIQEHDRLDKDKKSRAFMWGCAGFAVFLAALAAMKLKNSGYSQAVLIMSVLANAFIISQMAQINS